MRKTLGYQSLSGQLWQKAGCLDTMLGTNASKIKNQVSIKTKNGFKPETYSFKPGLGFCVFVYLSIATHFLTYLRINLKDHPSLSPHSFMPMRLDI